MRCLGGDVSRVVFVWPNLPCLPAAVSCPCQPPAAVSCPSQTPAAVSCPSQTPAAVSCPCQSPAAFSSPCFPAPNTAPNTSFSSSSSSWSYISEGDSCPSHSDTISRPCQPSAPIFSPCQSPEDIPCPCPCHLMPTPSLGYII
ncbi:hypothetical protein Pmani_038202 [Petrolisthes manimaculis]|uniref:Uncharacterized protein n=1 Tax=Petrolisthes manimaculis TaxID=1843537 RepID=A0AAE1NFC0_9EUCA|nr:hypothetical protein Pmani_038202 [Petrolisthes manimaculis]